MYKFPLDRWVEPGLKMWLMKPRFREGNRPGHGARSRKDWAWIRSLYSESTASGKPLVSDSQQPLVKANGVINMRVPQITKLRPRERESLTHSQLVDDLGMEPRTPALSWEGSDW